MSIILRYPPYDHNSTIAMYGEDNTSSPYTLKLEEKMMKKSVILLIIMLILSGCSNQPADITTQPVTPEVTAPQDTPGETQPEPAVTHIQRKLGDNTGIDAEVKVPASFEIPIIDIKLFLFDNEKVKIVLFKNETTTEEETSYGGHIIRGQSGNSCNYYSDKLNSTLSFRTEAMEYVFNVFRWQPEFSNLTLFTNETEFDFASRQDAINAVADAVKALGVQNTGSVSIYALDYDTLGSVQQQMIDSGEYSEYKFKQEWSKEDDCYFIMMDCVIQGVPVNSNDTLSLYEEATIMGSQITAVYSKKGIEFLQMANFNTPTNISGPSAIVSAEDAINAMGAKFETIITESKFTITGVELKYIPQIKDVSQNSLQLVPAWYFTVEEVYISNKDNSTREVTHNFMIDAYTGKEM